MVSLLIPASERDWDFVLADLMDAGTSGCTEESGGLRAFFANREAAETVALRYSVREVREENADALSSASVSPGDPIVVGDHFFIVPRLYEGLIPEGRLRLTVESGSAFGTGRHESTQLMLEAMERQVKSGMTVADVGCGSGILSQAALLLGAGRVTGCDIDPIFLGALPDELRSRVFVGSADGMRTQSADMVLANISAKVIDLIAYDLNRIARPGGLILLSGFIRERVPTRFVPVFETALDDWLCWMCVPQMVEESQVFAGVHSLQWY